VLILAACIVDEERFRVMKEENLAQHIFPALVSYQLRMAARIPHRNTKMVVTPADIVGDPRLCSGKHKIPDSRLPQTSFLINVGRDCGP
jgi:hypothetical protein